MQNPHVEYHESPQPLKECATKLIPELECIIIIIIIAELCIHCYLMKKIVLCSIWVLSVYSWKLQL